MTSGLATSISITIGVPPATVWDALTTPALIKQWFFGVDTETDWTEGAPIVHRGELLGAPYEDKGTTELAISETNLPSEEAWPAALIALEELLETSR